MFLDEEPESVTSVRKSSTSYGGSVLFQKLSREIVWTVLLVFLVFFIGFDRYLHFQYTNGVTGLVAQSRQAVASALRHHMERVGRGTRTANNLDDT